MKLGAPLYKQGFLNAVRLLAAQADRLEAENTRTSLSTAGTLLVQCYDLEVDVHRERQRDAQKLERACTLYERAADVAGSISVLGKLADVYCDDAVVLAQTLHRLYKVLKETGKTDVAAEIEKRCLLVIQEHVVRYPLELLSIHRDLILAACGGGKAAGPEVATPAIVTTPADVTTATTAAKAPTGKAPSGKTFEIVRGQVFYLKSTMQNEPHAHPWVIVGISQKNGPGVLVTAVSVSHQKPNGPFVEIPSNLLTPGDTRSSYIWIGSSTTFCSSNFRQPPIGVLSETIMNEIATQLGSFVQKPAMSSTPVVVVSNQKFKCGQVITINKERWLVLSSERMVKTTGKIRLAPISTKPGSPQGKIMLRSQLGMLDLSASKVVLVTELGEVKQNGRISETEATEVSKAVDRDYRSKWDESVA